MRITDVTTYIVGNPWKNWVIAKVDTDEGISGVGEGTLNAFAKTVEAAIHELRPRYIGMDPFQIETIFQRMTRDVYSDGGQIHKAAVCAIEVACWDIMGKALQADPQPDRRLVQSQTAGLRQWLVPGQSKSGVGRGERARGDRQGLHGT